MTPVLRYRFNLTTINPLETAGLGKILHILVASTGMLQMLPLILVNSPFPCIIACPGIDANEIFHIYVIFHQMISLDDTILL